jgi:hypothetical protein
MDLEPDSEKPQSGSEFMISGSQDLSFYAFPNAAPVSDLYENVLRLFRQGPQIQLESESVFMSHP